MILLSGMPKSKPNLFEENYELIEEDSGEEIELTIEYFLIDSLGILNSENFIFRQNLKFYK